MNKIRVGIPKEYFELNGMDEEVKEIIEKQDFIDAIDRIVGGLEKRNKIISRHEKEVIAYHESGHAAVSWLLEHGHPLVKVTIVPRGKSLGAAWYLPEERQITTFEQMFDEMTSTLGGRASEEIFFGKISTGALSDLEKITKQAYSMVVYFGLNDKIGNLSYYDSTGQQEYTFTKPYSEKTAETIDNEISKLIESAYVRAKQVINDNKGKIESLAQQLLTKEVIYREDLELIFGVRAFEEEKLIIGNLSVSKKSALFKCPSLCSFPVKIEFTSAENSILAVVKSFPLVSMLPSNFLNKPFTFEIIKCATLKDIVL